MPDGRPLGARSPAFDTDRRPALRLFPRFLLAITSRSAARANGNNPSKADACAPPGACLSLLFSVTDGGADTAAAPLFYRLLGYQSAARFWIKRRWRGLLLQRLRVPVRALIATFPLPLAHPNLLSSSRILIRDATVSLCRTTHRRNPMFHSSPGPQNPHVPRSHSPSSLPRMLSLRIHFFVTRGTH